MIFIDTGAWIALTDKSDQYHRQAARIYSALKVQKRRLLTTDYVIDETITRLRYDASHLIAVNFLDLITISERSGILTITRIDDSVFQKAILIFRQYDTAVLSFTDCTSFAVCEIFEIHQAFAFDQHFPMFGISLSTVGV